MILLTLFAIALLVCVGMYLTGKFIEWMINTTCPPYPSVSLTDLWGDGMEDVRSLDILSPRHCDCIEGGEYRDHLIIEARDGEGKVIRFDEESTKRLIAFSSCFDAEAGVREGWESFDLDDGIPVNDDRSEDASLFGITFNGRAIVPVRVMVPDLDEGESQNEDIEIAVFLMNEDGSGIMKDERGNSIFTRVDGVVMGRRKS